MKLIGLYETKMHKASDVLNMLLSLEGNDNKFTSNIEEADYIISYGGDGTILDAYQKFTNKTIIPIRDYDRCEFHDNILTYFQNENIQNKDVIKCCIDNNDKICRFGISEVVIRNNDLTQAIRFDLFINGVLYAENCIGDGIIVSTVLGSTGYFKNITNMFFTEGLGIGFINNTQRMSNLIVNNDSVIEIKLKRGTAELGIDHQIVNLTDNQSIKIEIDKTKKIKLLGYKENFMCSKCRNKRHSSYVNSIYKVI